MAKSRLNDVWEKVSVRGTPDDIPTVTSLSEMREMTESIRRYAENLSERSEGILGIIEGTFFKPNGKSINGRFYPASLWERVISEWESKGRPPMLGTWEHPGDFQDEFRYHPQYASHVVSSLDPKTGHGVAYLLKVPTGVALASFSKIRIDGKPLFEFYMSSRGMGELKGITEDGYEIVDPLSYELETFDVVLKPGIRDARVDIKLFESVRRVIDNINNEEGKEIVSINESETNYEIHFKSGLALIRLLDLKLD